MTDLVMNISSGVSNDEICNFAYNGQQALLQCRISEKPQFVNVKDQIDRTPLHWATSAGQRETADFLIDKGANVNATDDSGWTPLHIAASKGNATIAFTLLSKGADINAKNSTGQTPLHYAASRDR